MRSRIVRLTMLLLLVAGVVLPLNAKASPPPALAQYFPETGQTAVNYYWQFWKNTPNALRILGYPISAPFLQESFTEPGKFYMVQYFERAILEEHPENFANPRDGNKDFVLGPWPALWRAGGRARRTCCRRGGWRSFRNSSRMPSTCS